MQRQGGGRPAAVQGRHTPCLAPHTHAAAEDGASGECTRHMLASQDHARSLTGTGKVGCMCGVARHRCPVHMANSPSTALSTPPCTSQQHPQRWHLAHLCTAQPSDGQCCHRQHSKMPITRPAAGRRGPRAAPVLHAAAQPSCRQYQQQQPGALTHSTCTGCLRPHTQ
jgi:hypothetical protein